MSTINPRDIHTIDNVLIRAGQLSFVALLLAWLWQSGLALLAAGYPLCLGADPALCAKP